MALGPAVLLDVALNPRVQTAAGKLFNSVYSRIFKDEPRKPTASPAPSLVDLRVLAPAEQVFAERLNSIEQQIACLPTKDETAMAFASLQAEVRQGQKRLMLGVVMLVVLNIVSLLLLR